MTQAHNFSMVIAFVSVVSVLLPSRRIAQSGPGPMPSLWNYGSSLSIYYNNGEIDIGNPIAAGTLGPGWLNAAEGFAINGVSLPGAIRFFSERVQREYILYWLGQHRRSVQSGHLF
jgi:hypothetical protein